MLEEGSFKLRFNSSLGWEFDQETDRLGVGIGVYQTKVDKHLRSLLEWARTSKDSSEFLQKVSLPNFSSDQKRKYLEIIRNLLSKSKGKVTTHPPPQNLLLMRLYFPS